MYTEYRNLGYIAQDAARLTIWSYRAMAKNKGGTAEKPHTGTEEVKESKGDRFRRLAPKRVNDAIKRIRMVGQLATTATYEYSRDEAEAIVTALDTELKKVEDRFGGLTVTEQVFSLPGA